MTTEHIPDMDGDEEAYIDKVMEKSIESLAHNRERADDVYVTFQAQSVIYLIKRYRHLLNLRNNNLN